MEKNEDYKGEVIGLGTEGEGIIKCEGKTVFVPLCLPKEELFFRVLKVQKDIAYGKVMYVSRPSPDRTIPMCPVFPQCGGCSLQHMKYPAQLDYKSAMVRSSLKKIGGIDAEVSYTIPCDSAYRYRNKLALPIGLTPSGDPVCGFYAPRSHRIIPIRDCYIQEEWVKDIIHSITAYARILPLAQREKLRHVVARRVGDRHIIALVASQMVPTGPLMEILDSNFPDCTFLLNINPADTNVIFGPEWHTVRGEGYLKTEEGGISFTVGANTFMQVNDEIRSKLYAHVLNEAQGASIAIDLYSGGGLLTAMLARACGKAVGIEIVPEATQCANALMEENGLSGKMRNICGAAEDNIQILQMASKGGVIVCDPPRKGMERSVVKAIRDSRADKVILISCNPATLARDLGLLLGTLTEEGRELVKCARPVSPYRLKSVTPYDMFPQTKWCETVAVLERK
ncbi:MAG: 23S rRNA (uracil(1939)-C(5))-methyltransferase RlmD [Clostridia bacterium]|nr:23S rRNA (uracil(1939)-C(5))-methyltransferase RlmD [Clostridia bacterium]